MPCLPQSLSRCASPRMVRILHLRHSQRSADSPCQAAGRVSGPWLRAVHDGAHGDRSSRTLRRAAGGGGGGQKFRHGVLRDEVSEDPAALLRAAGEDAGAGTSAHFRQ